MVDSWLIMVHNGKKMDTGPTNNYFYGLPPGKRLQFAIENHHFE